MSVPTVQKSLDRMETLIVESQEQARQLEEIFRSGQAESNSRFEAMMEEQVTRFASLKTELSALRSDINTMKSGLNQKLDALDRKVTSLESTIKSALDEIADKEP
jgi:conjugal transfer/entry exclusion protein